MVTVRSVGDTTSQSHTYIVTFKHKGTTYDVNLTLNLDYKSTGYLIHRGPIIFDVDYAKMTDRVFGLVYVKPKDELWEKVHDALTDAVPPTFQL